MISSTHSAVKPLFQLCYPLLQSLHKKSKPISFSKNLQNKLNSTSPHIQPSLPISCSNLTKHNLFLSKKKDKKQDFNNQEKKKKFNNNQKIKGKCSHSDLSFYTIIECMQTKICFKINLFKKVLNPDFFFF